MREKSNPSDCTVAPARPADAFVMRVQCPQRIFITVRDQRRDALNGTADMLQRHVLASAGELFAQRPHRCLQFVGAVFFRIRLERLAEREQQRSQLTRFQGGRSQGKLLHGLDQYQNGLFAGIRRPTGGREQRQPFAQILGASPAQHARCVWFQPVDLAGQRLGRTSSPPGAPRHPSRIRWARARERSLRAAWRACPAPGFGGCELVLRPAIAAGLPPRLGEDPSAKRSSSGRGARPATVTSVFRSRRQAESVCRAGASPDRPEPC